MRKISNGMPHKPGRGRPYLIGNHYRPAGINDKKNHYRHGIDKKNHYRQGTVPARKGNAAERECAGKGMRFKGNTVFRKCLFGFRKKFDEKIPVNFSISLANFPGQVCAKKIARFFSGRRPDGIAAIQKRECRGKGMRFLGIQIAR